MGNSIIISYFNKNEEEINGVLNVEGCGKNYFVHTETRKNNPARDSNPESPDP